MSSSSLKKQYDNLLHTLHAYRDAVNQAAIVSITDTSGRILYVNDKFSAISGYTAAELIGQDHRIVNSGYHSSSFFKEMWNTIRHGGHWRGEIRNKAKNGSYYWVDTVITPVFDEANRIFQYLSVRNVITAQKENEEKLISIQQELMKREQQLKDAQQVAKTGSWHLDIKGNLEWSEETYRIFELPMGTPMTYETFLEKVHPEDRPFVDKNWQAALKGAPYELEHRIITSSGKKWIRERAKLEFDEAMNLKEAVGTAQDITEKKETEDILRESESLYKNLFYNSPFPNGIIDKETLQFMKVNEAAVKLYGYSAAEFLQLTVFDFRIPEEHDKVKVQLEKGVYAWDRAVRSHKTKNGKIIHIEPHITEINYRGKPAFLISINDVTERLKMQEQLILSSVTQQKEINRASLEAQEKNRADIGRELHDNVNQLLVATNLYLKNITPHSDKDGELIKKSIQIIATAMSEIRKLSWSLVPPSLADLSLIESIQNLASSFAMTPTVMEYDIKINESLLSEGLKISIYRIIQEQFSNIIKYADAPKVRIAMKQTGNSLTLEIADNGKGFDPKQKGKGIGLTNIIHRAETYNGKVTIESRPGHGCRIYIEFAL